ncbi:MAG: metallophosphoesterase [Lentisphaeria bacterium]|nr:metallophosphoesterase [Lentisphaeria bacterium]
MKQAIILFLFAAIAVYAEEPVLRAGIITDTHIGQTAESCSHVRKVFELFNVLKTDLIIHCGDIAELHYPAGYRHYRKIFNEVFAEPRPKELFSYAGHDCRGFKNDEEGYAIVKKEIGATNDIYDRLDLKGYPFLVFKQFPDLTKYEQMISQAEKDFPGKPVFVINHEPPVNTTYHSQFWGSPRLLQVLQKHPRVVQFTGHAHGSVRDERNIWQGKFTSVSAGCLQHWAGMLAGAPVYGKKSDGFLLLEVYPSKLLIRRFEYLTGKEYAPEKRWLIPLPFDEKNAPYNPEHLAHQSPAPEFPEKTVLHSRFHKGGLVLRFPEASGDVAEYRIELAEKRASGQWILFARHDQFSGFYLQKKPEYIQTVLPESYFTAGAQYRVRIFPVNFHNKSGAPLAAEFTAPELPQALAATEVIAPMKELPFTLDRTGTTPQIQNGFYALRNNAIAHLALPEDLFDNAPANAVFRLTADFCARQTAERPWAIIVVDQQRKKRATSRIGTVPGESGTMRYILEFKMPKPGTHYFLQFRGGGPGRIRFDRIRLERIR